MKNTTLCYLEQGECYLMLHRTKKEQDENAGKWVGVGGKFEPNESPDACLVREVQEETGLLLRSWRFCGVVSFLSDIYEAEQMFLFTSDDFSGTLRECDEGELAWVPKEQVPGLPLWEGDKIFLRLLARKAPPFLLTLRYEGQHLVQAVYNGAEINL